MMQAALGQGGVWESWCKRLLGVCRTAGLEDIRGFGADDNPVWRQNFYIWVTTLSYAVGSGTVFLSIIAGRVRPRDDGGGHASIKTVHGPPPTVQRQQVLVSPGQPVRHGGGGTDVLAPPAAPVSRGVCEGP